MTALVILLAVACAVNLLGTLALARQTGVILQRLGPARPLRLAEGPQPGDRLDLSSEGGLPLPEIVGNVVVAAISPTCGLCAELLPGLRRLERAGQPVIFAIDGSADAAVEYTRSRRIAALWVAHPSMFDRNHIPGAPWVVVTDPALVVLESGGVNTLEQVEQLVERAEQSQLRDHPETAEAHLAGSVSMEVPRRVHD